jgi:CPA2 family monovalent cation:H+ antiporter-2
MTVGLWLTQIGEFSFVLVQVARNSGLVGGNVYNATLAASLVTILVNAAQVRYLPNWIGQLRLARHAAARTAFARELENHVVLCGFGRIGGEVGTALDAFRIPYVVIEIDPDIVETLRSRGISCLFGDATHERLLHEAHIRTSSLVILALPDASKNQLVIRRIRHQNLPVPILARAHSRRDYETLLEAGASEIIQPELEASATLIRHALDYLKVPADLRSGYLDRFREAFRTARGGASATPHSLPNV